MKKLTTASGSVNIPAELTAKYNVSGPRYTSYPTALQFQDFTPSDLRSAIAESPFRDSDLSLYFHLPFCATLCYYCACNKIVTRKTAPAIEYLAHLYTELELYRDLISGRTVTQLHWGGGTPTFLTDQQMMELMAKTNACFNLASDDQGEFGIEVDPRTVDAGRIRHLRECGFNRISFGIQDFDPIVQKAVNRIQPFEDTRSVVDAARRYGFKSISVDLIYGLPHQNRDSFSRTLDQVCLLSPERISIYNYAHLPDRFSPQRRILTTDLPTANERLGILRLCIDRLLSEGYVYIGMDHFAKPDDELNIARVAGTLQRNFQGYSTHAETDLIGFGVTAISHIGHSYSQNEKEMVAYQASIEAGRLPVVKGIRMDEDDIIRSFVIRSLICQFELNYLSVATHFDIDFKSYFADQLAAMDDMVSDGLLTMDDEQITVTEKGRYFIRNICMVFDRYLSQQASPVSRYSRVV